MTLDGETLTRKEIAALLAGTEDLVLLRGQWVEIDRERLERTHAAVRGGRGAGAQRKGLTLRRRDAHAGRR